MHIFSSIKALFKREFLITYRNFSDVLSILTFFLLAIIIFVFSIGPNKEVFNEIGIGIIWTLILLSNTLSLKKFFQKFCCGWSHIFISYGFKKKNKRNWILH